MNQMSHRVNMCSEAGNLYASTVAIGLPEHFRLLGHLWNANYIKRKWKSSRGSRKYLTFGQGSQMPQVWLKWLSAEDNCSFLYACIQQPYDWLFIVSSPTPAQLWHTHLIRSSSGASLPFKRQFPSPPSSANSDCHRGDVGGNRVVEPRWCEPVLMADAIWRLMLGEAYSNGETEVRETITTERDKRQWEEHCCLL